MRSTLTFALASIGVACSPPSPRALPDAAELREDAAELREDAAELREDAGALIEDATMIVEEQPCTARFLTQPPREVIAGAPIAVELAVTSAASISLFLDRDGVLIELAVAPVAAPILSPCSPVRPIGWPSRACLRARRSIIPWARSASKSSIDSEIRSPRRKDR